MRMATVDPVTTSFATAAPSQPQLTNSMAANPLTTPVPGSLFLNPSGYPVVNPQLSHPNLNSANVATANAGGTNPSPGGAAASDQLELANTLSRLMLGSAGQSLALPQPNLLASMLAANAAASSFMAAGGVGSWGLAGQYSSMHSLLNAAAIQNLLSVTPNNGASLLSPSDQQQLLLNAGLSSMPSQTAVHSNTTLSGLAPVNAGHSGATAPSGGQLQSEAGGAQFGSNQSHPTSPPNASQRPAPRKSGR